MKLKVADTFPGTSEGNAQRNKLSLHAQNSSCTTQFRKTHLKRREVVIYTKPGNIPLYVNKRSNYPPRIIESIPKSINKRLSEISIDEQSFNEAAPLYQKALDDSGYDLCLYTKLITVFKHHQKEPPQKHYLVQPTF